MARPRGAGGSGGASTVDANFNSEVCPAARLEPRTHAGAGKECKPRGLPFRPVRRQDLDLRNRIDGMSWAVPAFPDSVQACLPCWKASGREEGDDTGTSLPRDAASGNVISPHNLFSSVDQGDARPAWQRVSGSFRVPRNE